MPPVNPEARKKMQKKIQGQDWPGASGLAEDVRYYGKWMRDEAEKRIGHLYPRAKLPDGGEASIIAWLWARTVKCPNPACGALMPLVRSFTLSTTKGKQTWIEPIVDTNRNIRFEIRTGQGKVHEGTVNRRGAHCIACGTPVGFDHIRAEGKEKRMGAQLMAIVAEGKKGRDYLPPSSDQADIAESVKPNNVPDTDMPEQALGFRVQLYGMKKHRDIFSLRQLCAISTFSELAREAIEKVKLDAIASGLSVDDLGVDFNGKGAKAYADAVATYLSFLVDTS
jgi:putative DNA methylase